MGVIGLIVASLVNIWLASPALMFAVSAIGVLIFAGLTAYDTQNIKNTYLQMRAAEGEAYIGKAAIIGALSALPELHQHVHDAAAALRPARVTRGDYLTEPGAGGDAGPFPFGLRPAMESSLRPLDP